MTAQTAGHAAREAFGELGADWYPGTPWHELHPDLRAQWEAAAQAAIDAATEGTIRALGFTLYQAAVDHYNDHRADWPDEGDLAEIATRAVEQEQAAAVDSIEDIPAIADAYAAAALQPDPGGDATNVPETEAGRLLGWAATLIGCAVPGPEMLPGQWHGTARQWRDDYYRWSEAQPQSAPKLRVGACPAHEDKRHVQMQNGGEWLCLRGLADLHEGALAAAQEQPAPELDGDVHVDWHMTPQEWESLSVVLRQHAEVPYIARLVESGKVPAPQAETQPAPGPHRHAFAASDCACDPSCECRQPKAREGS